MPSFQSVRPAVILVNLGTPEEPTAFGVKQFLGRFLSDRRVVDLPRYLWLPLLKGIILPLRSKRVARLYQKIWLKEGSPLKVLSQQLTDKVEVQLGDRFDIYLAMTYSQPLVQTVVKQLIDEGHDKVLLLPLFPQYSVSTTAPVLDAYFKCIQSSFYLPELRFVPHYYQHESYTRALAESIRRYWKINGRGEVLIFSFHGIPQRYSDLGDPYPQQCFDTAVSVAQELQLTDKQWHIAYQSRFGKEPWLMPYTGELLNQLALDEKAVVDIISPSFAVDCLETIEEIESELGAEFISAGGTTLNYIPALNASDDHVKLLTEVILSHAQGW